MQILKFGGTSLGTAERLSLVSDIIKYIFIPKFKRNIAD